MGPLQGCCHERVWTTQGKACICLWQQRGVGALWLWPASWQPCGSRYIEWPQPPLACLAVLSCLQPGRSVHRKIAQRKAVSLTKQTQPQPGLAGI